MHFINQQQILVTIVKHCRRKHGRCSRGSQATRRWTLQAQLYQLIDHGNSLEKTRLIQATSASVSITGYLLKHIVLLPNRTVKKDSVEYKKDYFGASMSYYSYSVSWFRGEMWCS